MTLAVTQEDVSWYLQHGGFPEYVEKWKKEKVIEVIDDEKNN